MKYLKKFIYIFLMAISFLLIDATIKIDALSLSEYIAYGKGVIEALLGIITK